MRSIFATSAVVIGLGLPGVTMAQELSLSAGATLTSRYVFNGIEQTTGAAFQPWAEAEYEGFYAGVWASNTARSIVGSSVEVDLYLGYRNEVGKFNYDLGYTRYYYRNPSNDCCGEVILSLGYSVLDPLDVGLRFAHDPVADYVNSSVSIATHSMTNLVLQPTTARSAMGDTTTGVSVAAMRSPITLALTRHGMTPVSVTDC